MYSGTTMRNASGNILGAHQKIDRVARLAFEQVMPGTAFPRAKEILHFEGKNGPDGIKHKSPARDEPWHYVNPTDENDVTLLELITLHSQNLTKALRQKNEARAAFEAAWLAHAIVDGLTPAHHFPLEEELERLRGEGIETRTTIKDKLIIKQAGDTGPQMLAKNWHYWGAKGIMTTHALFEWGVAVTISPLRLRNGYPNGNDLIRARSEGIITLFKEAALQIYGLKMYESFYKKGWTRTLAHQTRHELAPIIVRIVTLSWYLAALKAYGAPD